MNPWARKITIPSVTFKILFKPGDHFPIVQRKHFTVIEMFAFTGGLLGLFLGISVVTFAEVVNVLLQPLFKKMSATIWFRINSTSSGVRNNKFIATIGKVKSYFGFYLKESSIHSFNFIANAANFFERLFWFLTFSFSMTGCVFMILQLYQTMDFKAVTLIIDDQVMDVSEIPFPAVTIFGRFPSVFEMWKPKHTNSEQNDKSAISTIVSSAGTESTSPQPTTEYDYYDLQNQDLDLSMFELPHPTSR